MKVYLDNSATTKVYPEVAEIMMKVLLEDYGNPSSLHMKGVEAERYIKNSLRSLSGILKCRDDEIYFTSCGTESNNMAIIGTALAKRRKGKHIIVSSIEHASILETAHFLEKEGYDITFLVPDDRGIVSPEKVSEALREDTILVSVMMVNNELGSINPVKEIAAAVKNYDKDIIVHTDATQAFGKMEVSVLKLGVDLLTVSAHKIHGPKGIAALYVKKGTLLRPVIYGGGQQRGMRSGTENVPGIAGFGMAADLTYRKLSDNVKKMEALKGRLIKGLTLNENVTDNSGDAPHIASISFRGVRSEVMLHALEDRGIYVSSGSACSTNKPSKKGSKVLRDIGLSEADIESTIRFSLSEENTEEEVDYVIKTVSELLPMLRHYTRG
ncbi:MAG: cysteine desulfurase [Eubacterium sp.]|nr:cysteine desulfurase [Eubacterium sp.]